MAEPDPDPVSTYVVKAEAVRRALATLTSFKVHKSVNGYLAVLASATALGKTVDINPTFAAFFERHFRVSGAPPGKPFVVPLGSKGGEAGLFFNKNVAGSYAPSSIRAVNPLRHVMSINSAGPSYSLIPNHVAKALELILIGGPLPSFALGAYLFRDFGFATPSFKKEIGANLAEIFGGPFKATDVGGLVASGLFQDDSSSFSDEDMEALVEPAPAQ